MKKWIKRVFIGTMVFLLSTGNVYAMNTQIVEEGNFRDLGHYGHVKVYRENKLFNQTYVFYNYMSEEHMVTKDTDLVNHLEELKALGANSKDIKEIKHSIDKDRRNINTFNLFTLCSSIIVVLWSIRDYNLECAKRKKRARKKDRLEKEKRLRRIETI